MNGKDSIPDYETKTIETSGGVYLIPELESSRIREWS